MHYKTKQVVIFSLASYMNYSLNKSMCHHINKHSDIYLGQIALYLMICFCLFLSVACSEFVKLWFSFKKIIVIVTDLS